MIFYSKYILEHLKIAPIIFIFCVSIININAQNNEISFGYNDTHTGRNIDISYSHICKEKHVFSIGVHFLINKLVHDNNNNVYYKRFYATSADQVFGGQFSYKYLIPIKKLKSELFVFYELQETYSKTRSKALFPLGINPQSGEEIFEQILIITDRILALESTVGVGLNTRVYDNLFFNIKGGLGVVNYLLVPTDNNMNDPNDNSTTSDWEFAHIFSIGMSYRFKNK